ncbi:MAG: glutamate-1-semialdehyde 2,1-aminomutase [candidate division NC10 bacterium]|nr:glutamate-1-semialdehyde 2,1-aminomutase [candidate division NC10 bacterium]
MGDRSRQLFQDATRYFPGGVNSPVRAFRAVGGEPFFVAHASGSRITDADGRSYIDYVGSWGPMILGHAHPRVVAAIQKAAEAGTSYGAPTELETRLARLIQAAFPGMERMRFVSSGTEACMSALRVARGFARRDAIVKFEGCYHGHADSLLVKAGSGALTFGIPDSLGVPADLARHTLTLPYNDPDAVQAIFAKRGKEIAAVIVEPVAGNMGVIPPRPGFLAGLREVTARHGALLIFDEVITGFRIAWGGAQETSGVRPDLTCLGKIVGGGLPVGVYGGRADILDQVAPLGPIYQAGTLSGNPLAMAAGIETLTLLQAPGFYADLEARGARLAAGLARAAAAARLPVQTSRVGSMLTTFFTATAVTDYTTAKTADTTRYGAFFRAMLERGISLAPSQFEAAFISAAHTPDDLDATIAAAREAFGLVAG